MKIENREFLRWLIVMGLVEGTSTLVLFFVAMPLKYWGDMPMAVTIAGPVHGLLFLGLVAMFIIGRTVVPLKTNLMFWGIIGAIIPFGPFIVDVPLIGMLRRDATD
jgi:integral membrane protein